MNSEECIKFVNEAWERDIRKTLCQYVEVPNQSPHFDPEWKTNGLQEKAMNLLVDWVKSQKIEGLKLQLHQAENRTPLLFIEVAGTKEGDDVLMYGHMDKQPPLHEGWMEGLGAWKAVIKDGKLYGRGAADDGYAVFCAISAIAMLKQQNVDHSRIVILIEGSEESGSPDLPFYIDKLSQQIGSPSLVVCLDSGAGNYEQLWLTSSLRGLFVGDLKVQVLTEGLHSGLASGVVPSSFRIIRQLLERVEDAKTGKVLIKEAYVPIPADQLKYAELQAETLGSELVSYLPLTKGMTPTTTEYKELALNRAWRPQISYTGIDGIPDLASAGNVLRTQTTVKLSVRLPPTADSNKAAAAFTKALTTNVPYGANATFHVSKCSNGWKAPALDKWLVDALNTASNAFFNDKDFLCEGQGGSIPFMGMLGQKFPKAQFFITGLLGPSSNAHGPNEFMHIDFFKRLTCCVASVLGQQNAVALGEPDAKRRKQA